LERDRYRRLQDTGAAAIARLEQAETAYKIAQIELDKARADLADRRLRAPFDGVTGLATIETGDRIAVDDVIASFDDRSRILVEFDLPEALLGRIRSGLAISASTPAVEGRSFEGEITAIDSRVDPTTRTARVRASIDNSGDMLRPGTSFALRLDLPGNTYPAVPELALQFSRGTLSLWRVTDGRAEPVAVRLVRRRAGLVIVDGPLAEGDWIVIEGTQRLRPSTPVDVLNTPDGGSS
jgi:RND family efflux transporter MFP subunit